MIKFAIYKEDDTFRKLSALQVNDLGEYQGKFRDHLYCSEAGCEARIELAHRKGYPYFRTWRNSKHSPDCYYAFENDPIKMSMQSEETLLVAISSEHKRKALQYSSKKRKREEGGIPTVSHSTSAPRTNHQSTSSDGVRFIASVDSDATVVETVEREPSIPTRKCENVSTADVGKMINVYGRVNRASITDSSIRFFYNTHGGASVSILFFNRFRESFSQEYGWVLQIAQAINCGGISNLAVDCVSVCEQHDDCFDVQVFDEPSLLIEDKPISVFIRDFVQ